MGWNRTRDWIIELAAPDISLETAPLSLKSPKSRLQEHTQRSTGGRPAYRVLEATGPDHEKQFRIEVAVDGIVLGVGAGPSRRIAETAAAAEALEALRGRLALGGPARRAARRRATVAATAESRT